MSTLSAALGAGLRARGVAEPDASLAAETGIAVFRVAFGLWVAESERRSFGAILELALKRLQVLAAAG